jgi:hypothetical protein
MTIAKISTLIVNLLNLRGKMNFNDELEAVSFLEKQGITVSTEQCIFLPRKNTYVDEVHETIDYLIDVWDYSLNYI